MQDKIGEIIEKIPKDKKLFIFLRFILEFFYIILKPIINGFGEIINYGNKQKTDSKGVNYYINFLILLSLFSYILIICFGFYGNIKFIKNISFDKTLNTKNEIIKFFDNRTKLIKEGKCLDVAKMEKAFIDSSDEIKENWVNTCNNTLSNRIYSYDLLIQNISDIEDYKRAKVYLFEIEDKPDNGIVKTFYWQRTFYLDKINKSWQITKTTKNLISTKETNFK